MMPRDTIPAEWGVTISRKGDFPMAIKVDQKTCTGCGACIPNCPVEVLELKGGKCVYKGDGCIDCGACVPNCPVNALSL